MIRELAMKFVGVDPVHAPIPIRPVMHYTMGGISTDIDGATVLEGVWAAGEAACVSLHGANRLGSNSTTECLVWGKIAGEAAAAFALGLRSRPEYPSRAAAAARAAVFDDLLQREGGESLYEIRAEMRRNTDRRLGVYREESQLAEGLAQVRELRERYRRITIHDKSRVYNLDLIYAIELGFMLEVAEIAFLGALQRRESRGGHARRDFPERDDFHWLRHTLASWSPQGPRIDYSPVAITTWEPVERKY